MAARETGRGDDSLIKATLSQDEQYPPSTCSRYHHPLLATLCPRSPLAATRTRTLKIYRVSLNQRRYTQVLTFQNSRLHFFLFFLFYKFQLWENSYYIYIFINITFVIHLYIFYLICYVHIFTVQTLCLVISVYLSQIILQINLPVWLHKIQKLINVIYFFFLSSFLYFSLFINLHFVSKMDLFVFRDVFIFLVQITLQCSRKYKFVGTS